jgi:ferredoxin
MMLLTLGIKNLFGCVPGPRKALWHLKAGEDRRLFSRMLVDLYQMIQPSLTILDGVVAMEGNGPSSGDPVPVGLILAGGDALGVDQVVCDILGIPRRSLVTNRVALEKGMGRERIEILGERLDQIRVTGFKFPPLSRTDWSLPGFLKRAVKNALGTKPVVEKETCSACNRCLEICPPKALKKEDEELVFDYGTCIRCFCCQEVCPEGAISIKPGWMLRLCSRRGKVESGK